MRKKIEKTCFEQKEEDQVKNLIMYIESNIYSRNHVFSATHTSDSYIVIVDSVIMGVKMPTKTIFKYISKVLN